MKKLFLVILFFSFSAQAQNTSGAVSTATGGAGVSVVELSDSALLNPATIPLFRQKQINLSYSSDRFAAAIIDNGADAAFPAAVGYEQFSNNSFKNKTYHLILAYPLGTKFSLGVDFNLNETRFLNTETTYKQTRASAGLIWQPTKTIHLGLVHKNAALTDTDLPDVMDHAAVTTLGASYVYQNFAQLRFDIETVEKQPSGRYVYKAGIETYLNDWVITRFGYRNDNIALMNFTTLGLGFAGPQFGLHYAYQTEAKSAVDPLHVIDLTVPF